jgi:hypothetical protein
MAESNRETYPNTPHLGAKQERNHDMAKGLTHLIKLSVGTEDVADLADWQATPRAQTGDGLPRHVTRMWPKRADEVLDGGSIYWVIKGVILCRQPILRLDDYVGTDGIRRCAIVCKPGLIRTAPVQKRPFQGWRYLDPKDAPPDLAKSREGDDELPPLLSAQLADIGVL